MSLEEKYEALMKSYQAASSTNQDLQRRLDEIKGPTMYLRKQLDKSMKRKSVLESPTTSNLEALSEAESQHSIYEEDEWRRPVQAKRLPVNINSNDFRVDIPEFEGKLDLEEFFDYLSTVERLFKYKDAPEDKKVKLVALKLQKYASLWQKNLCAKRIRNWKKKIRSWEKMKTKLKARFLPSYYIQDSYAKLHNLF